jgi:hypothetical protein
VKLRSGNERRSQRREPTNSVVRPSGKREKNVRANFWVARPKSRPDSTTHSTSSSRAWSIHGAAKRWAGASVSADECQASAGASSGGKVN